MNMTIEDILKALPTKENLVSAVGLEPRSTGTGDMITAFATGMILGAGLAILFAPKSGNQVRHDIGEKLGELGEQMHARVSPPVASSDASAA